MKKTQNYNPSAANGWLAGTLFAAVLVLLFWRSFLPDFVHFSNDGPLGQQSTDFLKLPSALFGMWNDMNDTGFNAGFFGLGVTGLIKWLTGPVGFAKFFTPIGLFILGLGAWIFFRSLKFTPLSATLGALAAMLNSTFFGCACWGLAGDQIALGFNFLALALVSANRLDTPRLTRWVRLALAGLCVGTNVMEAADVGALCSLLIAGYVFWKSLAEVGGNIFTKAGRGLGRVALVAAFAGFIGLQSVIGLVGVSVTGIAGTAQDTQTKAQHWDFATQWSLPKKETLGIIIPGLFGYKMDTPNNMMPQLQDAYRGGAYWGGIGRDPALDRFLDAGGQGTPPSGFMRFSGYGYYCGILVALIAAWAAAQALRRKNSAFNDPQKKLVWFWLGVVLLSLPVAWGRFAPFSGSCDSPLFYALLYKLPYFSTIRNPNKFLFFFAWAIVILFAYGLDALSRRHLDRTAPKSAGMTLQLNSWWAKAGVFERRWTFVGCVLLVVSLLGWLIYAGQKNSLVHYLQAMGFPDETLAREIAGFSIRQAGWFVLLLAGALALVTLTLAGYFNGPRAKIGGFLLGGFLLFDLARADLPYVIHWDYKWKYEIGALNPIEDFLRDKSYEHRVAALPFEPQQPLRGYDSAFGGGGGLYRIEWMQHHFPYYNIQCLDLIQMPRMPEDMKAFYEALTPRGTPESLPLLARHWQLTNTRYLLGAAGFLNVLNSQLDPGENRFRIARRFDVVPKPGCLQPQTDEDLTAQPASDGDLAVFDFTGALPRAKLYSNWQVNTNDPAVLKTLADLGFDPAKTVLIDTPQKNLPARATNENTGTVAFKSYAPEHIVLVATNAAAPAVLLLNDKYDPTWRVTVDGKPAELLRCNFLMRGVYLEPGTHTVTFDFRMPNKLLYVTLSAMALGLLLGVYLWFAGRKVTGPSDGPKTPTAL